MPRKATSQKEKALKGDTTKRKETKDFVKIDPCEPDMPEWLNETAKKEWRRLVPLLAKAKVLTPLDGVALGMLCSHYATIEACLKVINNPKLGATFKSSNGHVCQRPEVSILKNTQQQYLKLCAEFGMTPKTRANMRVKTGDDGDDDSKGKTEEQSTFEFYFGTPRSAVAR
jgi:P27 family predicted phage terminase small subunit